MNSRKKSLALLLTGLLCLSAQVYADPDGARGAARGPRVEGCDFHGPALGGGPEGAQRGQFMQRRLEDLHGKLKLSSQQETAWQALSGQLKPLAGAERPDFAALSKLPTPERLDRLEALRKDHEALHQKRVAAIKDFYGQLSPEQRKIFDDNFMKPPKGDRRPPRAPQPDAKDAR